MSPDPRSNAPARSSRALIALVALSALASGAVAAAQGATPSSVRFDFRRSAVSQGFVVEGEQDGRFATIRGRRLTAGLESTQPGSRLVAPLPFTLDQDTSFRVEAELVLDDLVASPEDFFQVAFGLVRRAVTGLNRTGTSLPAPPFFVDDADTFESIDWSYYPNVTVFGGPTLVPTAFGAAAGPSAYWNFAANFGPSADLGDNGPGRVTSLPLGVPLRVVLEHDACARELRSRVLAVGAGGALEELVTGVEPLDLQFVASTGGYALDGFAIFAWQDLADPDPSTVSLAGQVSWHEALVEVLPSPTASVVPRASAPLAASGVKVVVRGARAGVVIRLVESGGVAVDVPLASRPAGDAIHVTVPRSHAVAGDLVLEVGACRVAVEPWAVPRPR